jgi:hypothetical protein
MSVKRGIDKAVDAITTELEKMSKPVKHRGHQRTALRSERDVLNETHQTVEPRALADEIMFVLARQSPSATAGDDR